MKWNRYYITVPKNEQGYKEHDIGIEHTENMEEFIVPEEEYIKLHRNGVFGVLENEYLDVYISDGESSELSAEQLKKVYNAISVLPGTFLTAVDKAIEYGTCILLDF